MFDSMYFDYPFPLTSEWIAAIEAALALDNLDELNELRDELDSWAAFEVGFGVDEPIVPEITCPCCGS